jgi:hypothetical protein
MSSEPFIELPEMSMIDIAKYAEIQYQGKTLIHVRSKDIHGWEVRVCRVSLDSETGRIFVVLMNSKEYGANKLDMIGEDGKSEQELCDDIFMRIDNYILELARDEYRKFRVLGGRVH